MDADQIELWQRADLVLDELLDLPAGERLDALERLDLDEKLRIHVRRLLEAGEIEEGPLDKAPGRFLGDGEEPEPDLSGRRFGPFTVEHEIGRGGMSVVYLARREVHGDGGAAPGFEQRVALKILTLAAALTPGSRLKREIAVLARLRHPHIATLIDAGVEDDGSRWLAMEWVEGEPIDRHCDGFEARQIVRLMGEVCEAVDYAHRNLIVHRDLKPSNILVDQEGHVRLLDFGIAKLLDAAGTGTQEATRVLTPSYAAPEQFLGTAVTTTTDVFGLGAVLFRLLSGNSPREKSEGLLPGPIDFSRLSGIDRDLSMILRQALHEEPERRYASVALVSEDLERWLGGHPVRAADDGVIYRLRKLAARNRLLTAISSLLILAVIVGTFSTYLQAERARAQAEVATREAERARAISDFLLDLFTFADPDHSQGESLTVRQALDAGAQQLEVRLEQEPRLRVELLGTVGEIYRRLGLYDDAEPLHARAVELAAGSDLEARAGLRKARLALSRFDADRVEAHIAPALADPEMRGEALQVLGQLRQAEDRGEEAVEALEEALSLAESRGESLEVIAAVKRAIANTIFDQGDLDRAGVLFGEALRATQQAYDGDHTAVAEALQSLGAWTLETGNEEGALGKLGEALKMRERLLGEQHPDVAYTVGLIGQVERSLGRYDDSEARLRRALDLQSARLGPNHPDVISTLNSLALLAYDRGDLDDSANQLEELILRVREARGDQHSMVAELLTNLAGTNRVRQDFERAEEALYEALEIYRQHYGEQNLDVAHCYSQLGNLSRALGDFEAAEDFYRRALDAAEPITDAGHPEILAQRANLAGLAFESGEQEKAIREFETALEGAHRALPAEHPLRLVIETRLARSLLRTARRTEALALTEPGLEILLRRYPPDAARRLEAEAVHAGALIAAGRGEEGEEIFASIKARLEAGAKSTSAEMELAHWRASSGDP